MSKVIRLKRLEDKTEGQRERVYVLAASDTERFFIGDEVYENREALEAAYPGKLIVIMSSRFTDAFLSLV